MAIVPLSRWASRSVVSFTGATALAELVKPVAEAMSRQLKDAILKKAKDGSPVADRDDDGE